MNKDIIQYLMHKPMIEPTREPPMNNKYNFQSISNLHENDKYNSPKERVASLQE